MLLCALLYRVIVYNTYFLCIGLSCVVLLRCDVVVLCCLVLNCRVVYRLVL